ncbi:DDE-type integrase/transposase/recombinase (plasmid) [Kozakia baliensis]|uniref:DDE-type integrase/transposase/recombinase n=1 Tax=Kozakia baliensis TaxID=153496 RepID=UPI00345BBFB7
MLLKCGIVIRGQLHWLRRAVDQDGTVLHEILQTWRNTKAAKRLLTRLLDTGRAHAPDACTDKLRSYDAARRKLKSSVRHLSHKGLNNRAENSSRLHRQRDLPSRIPCPGIRPIKNVITLTV